LATGKSGLRLIETGKEFLFMLSHLASKFSICMALGAGLVAAAPAHAQDYGDPYYRPVERYGRPDSLFDRVQRDLDRAVANPYTNGHTRRRVDDARRDVWRFQRRASEGKFDKHALDRAIGSVDEVVESDALDYRDRRELQRDVIEMREFRASGGYGDRYPERNRDYGYR
jgi:hypothetical protein